MRQLSILVVTYLAMGSAASGTIIVEHVGANDPTTEGWTLKDESSGQHIYGPVLNDLGYMNAWQMDTMTNHGSGDLLYTRNVSPIELSSLLSDGWSLTTTIRLIEGDPSTLIMAFFTGTRSYSLLLSGTPADADPILEFFGGNTVAISGGGGAYHVIRMIDDNADGLCSVFVDGALIAADYAGTPYPDAWDGGGFLEFGDNIYVSNRNGHARYSQVTLETVPEPATLSLLALGGLVAGWRRKIARVPA